MVVLGLPPKPTNDKSLGLLHLGIEKAWTLHGGFNSRDAMGCCSCGLARAWLAQNSLFTNQQLEVFGDLNN